MSAVSRKVTPSSMARWIVAIELNFVTVPIKIAHPHAAEAERGDERSRCT
jgi:hypothetical protein